MLRQRLFDRPGNGAMDISGPSASQQNIGLIVAA